MVQRVRHLPYKNIWKHLTLHSLERRRVRALGHLIKVFQMGLNKRERGRFLSVNEQARTRLNADLRKKGNGSLVDEQNRLRSQVVSVNTIESFKRTLYKLMDEDERWF